MRTSVGAVRMLAVTLTPVVLEGSVVRLEAMSADHVDALVAAATEWGYAARPRPGSSVGRAAHS